jgi:anti-anti-sigma regulatory factor
MKRQFGPYPVELIPDDVPGRFIAFADAADWYPRKSAELFDAAGLRAGFEAGVRAVVIDFSRRPYFNSGTLGALIKVDDFFRPHGGRVSFVGLTKNCEVALEMLGLADHFPRHPDRAAGVAAARNRSGRSSSGR